MSFLEFYAASIRGPLFSSFLSLGGFSFGVYAFAVLRLKQDVYDQPGYQKRVLRQAKLGRPEGRYDRLIRFSNRLFLAVVSCFITAFLQFSLGFVPHVAASVVCVVAALTSTVIMGSALLMLRANLRVWIAEAPDTDDDEPSQPAEDHGSVVAPTQEDEAASV